MPLQFAVLGSGSSGNAALLSAGSSSVLIDAGFGPRVLADRLRGVGRGWDTIAAAVLTHTHADHVDDATLRAFARHQVAFYAHTSHLDNLAGRPGFEALVARGLARPYGEVPFLTPNGARIEPVPLSHDGGPTFGFRVEMRPDRRERPIGVGYAADTGVWSEPLADAFAEVDVLAVEFNHDVDLETTSGRPWPLIERCLGNHGHLSNEQGAALVAEVLARSVARPPRHVVLLHLSRQCNRPQLAIDAAHAALRDVLGGRAKRLAVHAAGQFEPYPSLSIEAGVGRRAVHRGAAAVTHGPARSRRVEREPLLNLLAG
ncbi:MAG: MBL fold metallo-hydrolase [Planctomycetota bacterium]|nr:MBL fold metallo-hydrolase [Planctomycetota bacterium]